MNRTRRYAGRWAGGAVATVLVLGGCSGSDTSSEAAESTPPPNAGATLFSDSFDDDSNEWSLPENDVLRTTVEQGDFAWRAKALGDVRPHVLASPLGEAFDAGTLRMLDVVVSADVTPMEGEGAMGVFCREVRGTQADFEWYEFVVRDGYGAIRKADSAGDIEVLAKTDDVSLPRGEKATVEAACVDDASGRGQLWLSLDGDVLLHVEDPDPLGNGAPGLQAYDSPDEDPGARFLIRWHDFTVRRPAR